MAVTNIVQNTISLEDGEKTVGSLLTNPSSGGVVVDTGQLSEGNYLFGFLVTTSVAAIIDIQHRNAANSANIDSFRTRASQEGTGHILFPSKIRLATNERIRLVMGGTITGELQATIFYVKVY